ADGRARSRGVSNFSATDMKRVVTETGETPSVNQIELHPRLVQRELRRYHAEHAIATEARSPLEQGTLLGDPVMTRIAGELQRTPAQVIIRWHLQLGNIVIPKSVTPERIEQNFDVFGFDLSAEQMSAISGLDSGTRTGADPA